MLGFVRLPDRGFLRLSGPDRLGFLQGLVSNDVNAVRPGHAVYACLLTPQGKFLHDFFLIADGESLLIECEADRRGDLAQRLKTYRLRSKIDIAEADYAAYALLPHLSVIPAKAGIHGDVSAGGGMDSRFRGNDDIGMNDVFGKDSHGAVPEAAGAIVFPDPRMPALAARMAIPAGNADAAIGDTGLTALTFDDYEQARIAEAAPDGSRDMEVGKAILLENNIDLLNGIAWDKGCYTGQELTARTRYRGLIKKRLIPIRISGSVPPIGTPLIENGGEIGEMRSASGDLGLALIRLERLRQGGSIHVGDAVLTPQVPDALASAIAQVQP